jgi:hypothetical protein
MKLNLIFKKIDEITHLKETKIVPIDIPDLQEEDDWYLDGSCDVVTYTKPITAHPKEEITENNSEKLEKVSLESPISTSSTCINNKKDIEKNSQSYPTITLHSVSSKLFRANGKISLARINPGQEINEYLVYITDNERNEFFDDLKKTYGQYTSEYQLLEGHDLYDKWNSFITERYLAYCNNNLIVKSITYKNGKVVKR